MNNDLENQAKKLAARPYTVIITQDETTDGQPIYVLYNPELPHCMAQGWTIEEAQENLLDAREGYILSLLEDDLPVPPPEHDATKSVASVGDTVTIPLQPVYGSRLSASNKAYFDAHPEQPQVKAWDFLKNKDELADDEFGETSVTAIMWNK